MRALALLLTASLLDGCATVGYAPGTGADTGRACDPIDDCTANAGGDGGVLLPVLALVALATTPVLLRLSIANGKRGPAPSGMAN